MKFYLIYNGPHKSYRPFPKNPTTRREKLSLELLIRATLRDSPNIIGYCYCPLLPTPRGIR